LSLLLPPPLLLPLPLPLPLLLLLLLLPLLPLGMGGRALCSVSPARCAGSSFTCA